MSNTLLTPTTITKESLMVLENNLTFAKFVNREYSDMFARTGGKIGASANIRKPVRHVVQSGAGLSAQDISEPYTTITIDQQKHVDFQFSSVELTLTIDEFRDRYLNTAVAALANHIDRYMLQLAADSTYNFTGTPGTVPTDEASYLDAGVYLDDEATPRDGNRAAILTPRMQANLVKSQKGLFQSSDKIANQYESGTMGMAYGFKFSMDQNTITHTWGAQGGAALINGASQSGSSIVVDGFTASVAVRGKKSDVVTFAGVYAVNPQHRSSTGTLRRFILTADVSSDGAGNATLQVSPALVLTGPNQNVSALPADNAAVTFLGAPNTVSPEGLACHKDAFTLATVDLEDVSRYGAWGAVVSSKKLGISLRVARQYNISTDQIPCRVDVLFGGAALYPELACRIGS